MKNTKATIKPIFMLASIAEAYIAVMKEANKIPKIPSNDLCHPRESASNIIW